MISSPYISDAQFQKVVSDLNITDLVADIDQQSIVDRAAGDLESALCERYTVPLICDGGGDFSTAPSFARQKVLNAMYAKLRSILGKDKDRNIVIDATQKYVDVHEQDFKSHVKDLLDAKKNFVFQLNEYSDGSYNPLQSLGLARSKDNTHRRDRGSWDDEC